jgi:hypothetical protein
MPFFPRILEHLVGLDHRVIERQGIGGPQGVVLELVPQVQQVLPVPVQFASQTGRGRALGDAPEDQEDLRGAAVGLAEDGLGEGVEDPAARAVVVQDRGTGPAVDPKSLATLAARAGQSLGVEDLDKSLVAGLLVHQLGDREIHGSLRGRGPRCDPALEFTSTSSPSGIDEHQSPHMSQL